MTTKTDTKTSSLIINELTKDQYTQALSEGQISEDELYLVTGEEYSKGEIDKLVQDAKDELQTKIDLKANEFQVAGDYATNSKVTEVETTANNAKAIAEGKATGYVFDTKEVMDSWIQEHSSELKLGDNLYIRTVDVPDYWWDGEQAQQLETQKVDLTDYTTKTDLSNGLATKQDTISNLSTIESNASNGASAYTTIQGYGDIVAHNAIEFALKSEIPDVSKFALDSGVVHKADSESITGQKTFKLNNTFANNTLDAIFANGIFIGDGMSSTTSRLFNTRWCNNAFQIKTSQDIGYSYLAGSTSTNYGLKYQVQRMPSRSSQPTSAGVVEAGMCLSYDGLIVGYSEQANKKVEDNEFIYVLDQKSVKTKTIDTLQTTDKTIIGAINEINSKPSGTYTTTTYDTENKRLIFNIGV